MDEETRQEFAFVNERFEAVVEMLTKLSVSHVRLEGKVDRLEGKIDHIMAHLGIHPRQARQAAGDD